LFQAISAGRASVVTGQIDTFTENGILLQSGEKLEADIIVSATGLQMLALGGVRLTVDATPVDPGHAFVYRSDAEQRPQLRVLRGLHQCLLDAARGFGFDFRLPPAEIHGSSRLSHQCAGM
jgi:cation diffusion facilitator CzcD-associated flavoprotein CzcO